MIVDDLTASQNGLDYILRENVHAFAWNEFSLALVFNIRLVASINNRQLKQALSILD